MQVVTGNGDDQLLSTHRFTVKREEGAAGIRKIIEETVREFYDHKITAVGIGFGGPVNRITGQIATSFHIEGWSGFDIRQWLASVIKVPVFIENDANVAALGEATLGIGKNYHNVLYITIGSGVGGGLIIDRQIYHGAIPGEIEIGHTQMDRNGTTLQDLCSGWAVDEKIRSVVAAHPSSILAQLVGERKTGEAIFLLEALKANDPFAHEIIEKTTDDLAFGLSHAIHLLHPEVVILGGGLSFLGGVLESRITKKLPSYLMKAFIPAPAIKLSQLKEKAVPIGALVLCSQNM